MLLQGPNLQMTQNRFFSAHKSMQKAHICTFSKGNCIFANVNKFIHKQLLKASQKNVYRFSSNCHSSEFPHAWQQNLSFVKNWWVLDIKGNLSILSIFLFVLTRIEFQTDLFCYSFPIVVKGVLGKTDCFLYFPSAGLSFQTH